MLGTLIGIIFVLIILGVIWWAVVSKFYPLIQPYVAEPFATAIYVLIVVIFVCIVLWLMVQVLSMAGVHVNTFGILSGGR